MDFPTLSDSLASVDDRPPMNEPRRGRLLVATPDLKDPHFSTAVVLLLEHEDEGSAGLILNRPSETTVEDALNGHAQLDPSGSEPAVVFVGGPVQPDAAAILARVPDIASTDDVEPILEDVGIVSLRQDGTPTVGRFTAFRIFIGYAGWGPGQLEDEIGRGGWFVLDGLPEDVFTSDTSDLWHRVLQRQGGVFANATDTPALN